MSNEKTYGPIPMVWLKMSSYMHGWLDYELGCAVMAHGKHVLCVQHLEGARDVLRMESMEDQMTPGQTQAAMSVTRRNCIEAGMVLNAEVVERMYGVTKETLALYVPVECPKMCLTKLGVLRPWTRDVTFSKAQAQAMQKLLNGFFWKSVADFDARYVHEGRHSDEKMLEAFCKATRTPDVYVAALRREWQRKKGEVCSQNYNSL